MVRSRVGARDDVQVGHWMRARKEPIQENLPPANSDRSSTVCSSESLVPAGSPMLIHIPRRNHLSDTISPDPDGPLQIRRSSSIGFDQVVVVLAQQAQVRQRSGSALLPRDDVVSVTVSGWPAAAGEHTAAVAGMQGLPDGCRDESMLLANIEHPGRSAQHDRQNVGVTCVLA